MATNRMELQDKIAKLSFAMDDTRLFLDTHPGNKEALAFYKETAKARKQAVAEYNDCFGPLNWYDTFDGMEWKWVDAPWPWEGRC